MPSIQADVIIKSDSNSIFEILAVHLPPLFRGFMIADVTNGQHQRNVPFSTNNLPDCVQVRYLLPGKSSAAHAVYNEANTTTALQARLDRSPR